MAGITYLPAAGGDVRPGVAPPVIGPNVTSQQQTPGYAGAVGQGLGELGPLIEALRRARLLKQAQAKELLKNPVTPAPTPDFGMSRPQIDAGLNVPNSPTSPGGFGDGSG